MAVTNLTDTLGYENDRFVFSDGNAFPGSSQTQSTTGDGVTRTEYTQAAATDSDGAGGDFDVVLGAKDGIGDLCSFNVSRELTPGGTRFNAFSVTPGATDLDPTTITAIGGVTFGGALTFAASRTFPDMPSGGDLGPATTSTDLYNVFIVDQTTAGQTLLLQPPSDGRSGRPAIVVNSGSADFIIFGVTVGAGTCVFAVYDNNESANMWRVDTSASPASAGSAGFVQLSAGGGLFAYDPVGLYWDSSAHKLGFGCIPDQKISFASSSQINTQVGILSLSASEHLILEANEDIFIGTATATTTTIGRGSQDMLINGRVVITSQGAAAFTSAGGLQLTAGASSTWSSGAALTIDAATTLDLGLSTATQVRIGHSGITTFVGGSFQSSGGQITLTATGNSGFTVASGSLTLSGTTFALSSTGNSTIAVSAGTLGIDSSGTLSVAATNAVTVNIGHTGTTTTVIGSFAQSGTGTFLCNPSGNSQLRAVSGTLLIEAGTASTLSLGTTFANAVAIGHSGKTTTITGNFAQLTGSITMNGNATSSIVTSGSAALTLTSAVDATWSTAAGILTLNGTGGLTLDASNQPVNVGVTNASAVNIGKSSTTTTVTGNHIAFACADVKMPGLNVVVSTALNYDGATGAIGPVTSSRRFKENISPLRIDSAVVYDLHAVSYTRKNIDNAAHEFGFVAEDVVKVLPELVPLDAEGLPFSVNYERVCVLLLEEMRKLKSRVDAMATELGRMVR